jgi:hypothetical protein
MEIRSKEKPYESNRVTKKKEMKTENRSKFIILWEAITEVTDIHIYIYIYIYTHTHTHTRTCSLPF